MFGQSQQNKALGTGLFPAGSLAGGPSGTSGTGNTAAPASGGGLFGSTNTNTASSTTGGGTSLFGNSNTNPGTSNATGGTGLFGSTNTATTTTSATGGTGLFGNTGATNPGSSNTGGGSGLFGNSATNTNTGGTTFGASMNQSQSTQKPSLWGPSAAGGATAQGGATGGTGLFGASTSNTGSGGGLFGAQAKTMFGQPAQGQQQPQQAQPSTGLFGSTTQANLQPSTSLFGSTTNQTNPQQGTGLFGASTTQQPQQQQAGGGLFGSTPGTFSTFGQSQVTSTGLGQMTQQPQQASALLSKNSKFNDLPEDFKSTLEQLESYINGRTQIAKDLKSRKLGEETQKGQLQVKSVHHDLISVMHTTKSDLGQTQDLKHKTDQAVQDTITAAQIIEAVRNPQNSHWMAENAGFPLEYFTRVTERLKERFSWCKSAIDQIERKLASLSTAASSGAGISPQTVVHTLQVQHASLQALAAKLASLDGELSKIKPIYIKLWQERSESARDPFEYSGDNLG